MINNIFCGRPHMKKNPKNIENNLITASYIKRKCVELIQEAGREGIFEVLAKYRF